jgi:hypothetical protein
VNISNARSKLQTTFDFNRSPSRQDGILFFFYSPTSSDYFNLALVDGNLISITSVSDSSVVHRHSQFPLPAAEWVSISVTLRRNKLFVNVSGSVRDSRELEFNVAQFVRTLTYLYIAGLPEAKYSLYPELPTHSSFHGCMRNWKVAFSDINFNESSNQVLENAHMKNGCCVETNLQCEPDEEEHVVVPSDCSLGRFNVSWSKIQVTGGRLQLSEGGQTALDTNLFHVKFPPDTVGMLVDVQESVHDSLTFTVVVPPKHGTLKYSRRSARVIEQFNFVKLELSSIFYIHDGTESFRDVIEFQLNATCHSGFVVFSRTLFVNIAIRPQNDPPVISHLSTLRLAVGTRTTLSREVLSVTDPDSNQDTIRFEVVDVKNGRFEHVDRPGVEIRQFQQLELVNGRISFQHFNASGELPFSTLFIIKDEQSSIYQQLSVDPFIGKISVVNNSCLKVIESSSGLLQSRTLGVTTNFEFQNPQINFTLRSAPIYGVMEAFRTSSPSLQGSWQRISLKGAFTRAEVSMNLVRYLHNSTQSNTAQFDNFVLSISSYEATGPHVTQCIEVIPHDSLLESRFDLVTRPLHLREGQTVTFDSSYIQVSLLPNSLVQFLEERTGFESIGILFTMIVPPKYGSVLLNNQPLNGSSFTLPQLRAGQLSYAHNGSEHHNDSITLIVESTMVERTELRIHPPDVATTVLPIVIQPVNNHPPVVRLLADITPLEGGLEVVDSTFIDITDLDGPGDVVTLVVERRPNDNGYFAFGANFSTAITQFTMEDVRSGSLVFLHLFGSALERRYQLSISDEQHSLSAFITVRARPIFLNVSVGDAGLSCPYVFDATEQVGYKFSSESFHITTDAPQRVLDVKVLVSRVPYHGRLILNTRVLSRDDEFDMRSVNSGDFKYDFSQDLTKQTYVDNFTLTFVLGSSSKLVFVPICINPVPVPKLITDPNSLKIRVPVNGVEHLTPNLLFSSDSRGGLFPERLIYDITIAPSLGSLVNISEGDKPIVKFTQADINKNHIAYVHKGIEQSSNDNFTFKLRNAFATLPPTQFLVDVYHTNLTVVKASFLVDEGSTHVITSEEFQIHSPPGYSVWITVITQPHHGVLLYGSQSLKKVGTRVITPRDIAKGLLSYKHDDSETSHDSFEFEVYPNITDHVARNTYAGIANHIRNYRGVVRINITLLNDNAPMYVYNNPLIRIVVWEGGNVNINGSVLLFHDVDIGDDDSNLIYNVTSLLGIECGYFYLTTSPGIPIHTFRQSDVLVGNLWYRHVRSSGCLNRIFFSDTYLLDVSDGQRSTRQSLFVEIKKFVIVPVVHSLKVYEGGTGAITAQNLSAFVRGNNAVNDSAFLFTIVQRPAHGVLRINESSFTLEYLKNMPLIYIHDDSDTTEDSFVFFVTVQNFTSEVKNFTIEVTPVDDSTPVFEVVRSVRVEEGGRIYFNSNDLRASDADRGPAELYFIVSSAPMYGTLYKNLPEDRWELVSRFTQQDINHELIYYLNERVSSSWTDSFKLVLNDGRNVNKDLGVLFITITPRVLPVETQTLNVYENSVSPLDSSLIQIPHPDYVGQEFIFRVTQHPVHGKLHKIGELQASAFTSADLEGGRLIYVHDSSETRSDEFKIVVTAGANNISSNPVVVHINIIPVNDEKPEMTDPFPILSVSNGDSITVSSQLLSATDKDTHPSDLTYYFFPPPPQGNTSVAFFATKNDTQTPVFSFSQWDIELRSIIFVHPGNLFNSSWPFRISDGVNVIFGNLTIRGIPIYINFANNVPISVDMEGSVVISTSELKLETSDGLYRTIFYKVFNVCVHGDLMLDGRVLSENDTFTQEDVDHHLLSYKHHDMKLWEDTDSFQFQATVPFAEIPGISKYEIRINLRQSNTSRFAVNRPLEVEEGGKVCITSEYLDARNIRYEAWLNSSRAFSISEMNIRFEVIPNPLQQGKVCAELSGSPKGVFWQSDEGEYACYQHNGSDIAVNILHLQLQIFPPNSSYGDKSVIDIITENFTIHILPVNDEIPSIVPGASLEVVIVHGFEHTISSSELAVVDPDTPPEEIVFTITDKPEGVYLTLDGLYVLNFTQADIDNNLVRLKHDAQLLLAEDQFSFEFFDGVHFGNGTVSIKVMPHTLLYTGTPVLEYTQDDRAVPISNSLLNIRTNGLRSETFYSFSSPPAKGLVRKNISTFVNDFSQTDVDNDLLFYIPQDLSSLSDNFSLIIQNRKESITVTVEIFVKSKVRIKSVTLETGAPNRLEYVLPSVLFAFDNTPPNDSMRVYALTDPLYGGLSRRSRTVKRQIGDSFDFNYSELKSNLIYYTVRKEFQSSTAVELIENFEAGVKLSPSGQLGFVNVTFKVVVPPPSPPTTEIQTPTTDSSHGYPDTNSDFSVYIVIPILGTAFVMMIVISIIFGSLVVRYYRLRKREKRRKKLQRAKQREAKMGCSSTEDYSHTDRQIDSSSEGTIQDNQERYVKFPSPNQSASPTAHLRGMQPGSVEYGSPNLHNSPRQTSLEPIAVPIPRPKGEVPRLKEEESHPSYSPGISPDPTSYSTSYLRMSPTPKSCSNKEHLKYDTANVDPTVKKLFRSDHPQLKHVEYWV